MPWPGRFRTPGSVSHVLDGSRARFYVDKKVSEAILDLHVTRDRNIVRQLVGGNGDGRLETGARHPKELNGPAAAYGGTERSHFFA